MPGLTEQTEHLAENSLPGESFHSDSDRQPKHGHASIQTFGVENHRISCRLSGPKRRIRSQQNNCMIKCGANLKGVVRCPAVSKAHHVSFVVAELNQLADAVCR